MPGIIDIYRGTFRAGAVVNLAAAGVANAAAIFQQSNWAQQVGTKTFKIKRITITNNAAGNVYLNVGTGVAGAFVARCPALMSINNQTIDYNERDLPEYEYNADCTAFPAALAVGSSLDVTVEVEEIG